MRRPIPIVEGRSTDRSPPCYGNVRLKFRYGFVDWT
jgi:hypothetical protein